MDLLPKQFSFTLTPDEARLITDTPSVGGGGFQGLQRRLADQLIHGNVVELDYAGLGQLIHYATQMGEGGFQNRLRQAFRRELRVLLDPVHRGRWRE